MLTVCKNKDELAIRAAEIVIQSARDAIAARGRFLFVLAGGSTPEATYRLLVQPDYLDQIDWTNTYVFLGDERLVSPTDPRSNFALAERTLLTKAPILAEHVFPIVTSWDSAEQAAAAYAETLAAFFGTSVSGPPPVFDLILLGMGDDGHTASLFPGMPSLAVTDKWVVGSPPGILPPPVDRVTLTFPVLNAARRVMFLISGDKKAEALQDVLEDAPAPEKRPSAGVRPAYGELAWLVDEAAARLLTHQ